MKITWQIAYTSIVCLLLVGGLAATAILVHDRFPWLAGPTLLANCAIIYTAYKLIMDFLKSANELQKVGLEVEKLKLEIDEKLKNLEEKEARVKIATWEDMQKLLELKQQKSTAMFSANARNFALVAICAVGASVFALVKVIPPPHTAHLNNGTSAANGKNNETGHVKTQIEPDFTGDWIGIIPNSNLPIVLQLSETSSGIRGTIRSPCEANYGAPIEYGVWDGQTLVLRALGNKGLTEEVVVVPDSDGLELNGRLHVGDLTVPMKFSREGKEGVNCLKITP